MPLPVKLVIALIAVEHFYILWLEMFAWTTRGKKFFYFLPKELFEKTKILAANQGLYNGFLAAGLMWSLVIQDAAWSKCVALYFLCCIAIAGIYGAVTAIRSILYMQSLPAFVALVLLLFT